MIIFVTGSGLREVAGDQDALGLTFIREERTAPIYRLYVVAGRFAALVEVEADGISVPGELCDLDDGRAGALLANEPPGVKQGPVKLISGGSAPGPIATIETLPTGSRDISSYGGFARYWRSIK
jgi:hypothetical protein